MSLVQKQIDSGREEPDPEALGEELLQDPERLAELMNFLDFALTRVMVRPQVSLIPEDSEREEGKLYVDDIALEDKFFVFRYAIGGTADLEKFREQLASSVDAVQPVKAAAPKAKSTRRNKK